MGGIDWDKVRRQVDADNEAWAQFTLLVEEFPREVMTEVIRLVWERDKIVDREINDYTLAVWMEMFRGRDPAAVLDAARWVCMPGVIDGDVALCHIYQCARLFEGLPYGS